MIIGAKLRIIFPGKGFRVSEIYNPDTGTRYVLSIDNGSFEGVFKTYDEMSAFVNSWFEHKTRVVKTCNVCKVEIPQSYIIHLCNKCLLKDGPKQEQITVEKPLFVKDIIGHG